MGGFGPYETTVLLNNPTFQFPPAPHLVAPDWGSRLARRWFSSTQQDDCQVCHQKRLSENYPLPNLSITFQTCHRIDDEISSLYVYKNRKALLMATVWQIFNIKQTQSPETEIMRICWNLQGKNLWTWLVILMPAIVWQILNVKGNISCGNGNDFSNMSWWWN